MTNWTQPVLCRKCAYPVSGQHRLCPDCGQALAPFSKPQLGRWLASLRKAGRTLWKGLQLCLLAALAGYLLHRFALVLVFLPLLFVWQRPSAGRGGKTVVRGRRRSGRSRRRGFRTSSFG